MLIILCFSNFVYNRYFDTAIIPICFYVSSCFVHLSHGAEGLSGGRGCGLWILSAYSFGTGIGTFFAKMLIAGLNWMLDC